MLAAVAGLAVLDAERGAAGATITTYGDAVWWACSTMSTAGHGDVHPVTTLGRCVGVGVMVCGITLLGTVTATSASWLLQSVAAEAGDTVGESLDRSGLEGQVMMLRDQVSALSVQLREALGGR